MDPEVLFFFDWALVFIHTSLTLMNNQGARLEKYRNASGSSFNEATPKDPDTFGKGKRCQSPPQKVPDPKSQNSLMQYALRAPETLKQK